MKKCCNKSERLYEDARLLIDGYRRITGACPTAAQIKIGLARLGNIQLKAPGTFVRRLQDAAFIEMFIRGATLRAQIIINVNGKPPHCFASIPAADNALLISRLSHAFPDWFFVVHPLPWYKNRLFRYTRREIDGYRFHFKDDCKTTVRITDA